MTSAGHAGEKGVVLVLFGAGAPDEPMGWVQIQARDGQIHAHGIAAQASALPAAPASRTILVLPGSEAQVKRIALQARTDAQARAGVGYLFEGSLVGGDGVHFAIGAAQDSEGHRLAAALSSARMTEWLDACRRLGANPRAIYLDFTLWPVEPDCVEVVGDGDRAMVAGGKAGGYAIETALAAALLPRWASQNGARINRLGVTIDVSRQWTAPTLPGQPTVLERGTSDVRQTLAAAAIDPPDYAPNLRQGDFAVSGAAVPSWRLWRFAAAMAIIAVLVQGGANGLAGWRDGQAAKTVLAAAERDFRAARPEVKRIVNLRTQVRAMANSHNQADAHPVLKATGPIISAQQAQPLARLDEMRHQAPGRTIILRFSADTAQPLEALAASMRAGGSAVESRDLRPENGRYIVEIQLESPS